MLTSILLSATLATIPLPQIYPPTCEVVYAWNSGAGATSAGSLSVAPNATEVVGRTEMVRVQNAGSRRVEVEVTIPTGGSKWVTLHRQGEVDPPVGGYLGNVTLKTVRCPRLFPTAGHMVADGAGFGEDVEGLFEAAAAEFGVGAGEIARAAAPTLGATTHERAEGIRNLADAFGSGAIDEILVGLRTAGWSDDLLAATYGAYERGTNGTSALPGAVSRLRGMGMSASTVLAGMEEWDALTDELWYATWVQGLLPLAQGGFPLDAVALAIDEVHDEEPQTAFSWLSGLVIPELGHAHAGAAVEAVMAAFGISVPDFFYAGAPPWYHERVFLALRGLGRSLDLTCAEAGQNVSPEEITEDLSEILTKPELFRCLKVVGTTATHLADLARSGALGETEGMALEEPATWMRGAGYDAAEAFLVLEAYASVFWQDTAGRLLRALIQGGYGAAPSIDAASSHLGGQESAAALAGLVGWNALARALAVAYPGTSHAHLARWLTAARLPVEAAVEAVAQGLRLAPTEVDALRRELGLKPARRGGVVRL